MAGGKKRNPILARLQQLRDRYRAQTLIVIAIAAGLLLIVSKFFPGIEQFVRQNNVIEVVTLLILIDVAIAFEGYRVDQSIRVVENQDESLEELIDAVPKASRADLLEYAASTTLPLIRAIQRSNVPVRLLIKHPETIEGLQRDRSITTLDTLFNSVFDEHTGKFEIRCYKLPFSLRGRYLHGRMLELGWLTPDDKRKTAYGHANPSSLVAMPNRRNDHLREFFERTFKDYWEHPETEPGYEVLKRLQAGRTASAQEKTVNE